MIEINEPPMFAGCLKVELYKEIHDGVSKLLPDERARITLGVPSILGRRRRTAVIPDKATDVSGPHPHLYGVSLIPATAKNQDETPGLRLTSSRRTSWKGRQQLVNPQVVVPMLLLYFSSSSFLDTNTRSRQPRRRF
ncbi:hypothetical protein KQX54_005705 [Cotesia glomerata]|uniref:Uncharacterized protein n=1 Tax=Cotesia glomerata TaxID=32391 RepID=A0AAV7IG77_COTGL|nr:hypothetical protein KQX54_005705 [Cotesia glomerata]